MNSASLPPRRSRRARRIWPVPARQQPRRSYEGRPPGPGWRRPRSRPPAGRGHGRGLPARPGAWTAVRRASRRGAAEAGSAVRLVPPAALQCGGPKGSSLTVTRGPTGGLREWAESTAVVMYGPNYRSWARPRGDHWRLGFPVRRWRRSRQGRTKTSEWTRTGRPTMYSESPRQGAGAEGRPSAWPSGSRAGRRSAGLRPVLRCSPANRPVLGVAPPWRRLVKRWL